MSCVLVIDDDDLVREFMQTVLALEGHEVVLARDGRKGMCQLASHRFDLVFCDVFMPDQDGFATLRELREMRPGLPVVMMTGGPMMTQTGAPDIDILRMALGLGATQTLEKPFDGEAMLGLLRRCLEPPATPANRMI